MSLDQNSHLMTIRKYIQTKWGANKDNFEFNFEIVGWKEWEYKKLYIMNISTYRQTDIWWYRIIDDGLIDKKNNELIYSLAASENF